MLAHPTLANPPLQEDMESLLAGTPRMVTVDFPKDKKWADDTVYGKLKEAYYVAYNEHMSRIKVPAVMTHCTIDDVFDDPERKYAHTARVRYHSMVLVPRRWTVSADVSEKPVGGNGEVIRVHEEEEEAELGITIEFNAKAAVEGRKGPATASVDGGAGFGAKWRKMVKVTTKHTQTLEAGCIYQPTRVFARLVCDVVMAKTGEFAVMSSGGELNLPVELVSTRPAHLDMEARFRTSTPNFGYQKSVKEMDALYRACGTQLITLRSPSSEAVWNYMRVSSAKLKLVVDVEEARLWVTGTAASLEWKGIYLNGGEQLKQGVIAQENEHIVAKLDDYRGLWGKVAKKDYEEEITYMSKEPIHVLKTYLKIYGN
ncbi:hypothetical protein BGZ99_001289 [Dissophora globulifera]|uniref:Uncharacterized protein n=1 Tax=Dissophora globulifera TaxID=979702 RepID=A0A9P6RQT0_9FUNG|nr:hypothetical protein BGZ99_001289 [Dissophora globulifera]